MTSRREFFKYAGIAGGAVAATAVSRVAMAALPEPVIQSSPQTMAVTEEEEMRSQFGDVYDLYAKRTPRFFPNLSPSSGTPKD